MEHHDTESDSAAAEAAVRRFYEALTTGDLALVDLALAPGWTAEPPLRTGAGPQGWKDSIGHLRRVFGDLHVTVEEIVVAGDRVAVRSVNRGVHTGELLGVAGTGRPVEFRAFDMHRLEGGRIVATWHLEDYFAIAAQIGLSLSRAA